MPKPVKGILQIFSKKKHLVTLSCVYPIVNPFLRGGCVEVKQKMEIQELTQITLDVFVPWSELERKPSGTFSTCPGGQEEGDWFHVSFFFVW